MLLLEFFRVKAIRHELIHGCDKHSGGHWLGHVHWEVSGGELSQSLATHPAGRCEMILLVGDDRDCFKRLEALADGLADGSPFSAEGRAVGAILDVAS